MPYVTDRRASTQYDGSNVADVLAWLDGTYTVLSETETTLVLRDGEGTRKPIPTGGWLVRDANRSLVWYGSAAAYEERWVVVAP
ncbi:hypothetical protein [Streptomyces silvensis]|uniref:Uncharacterized protein n=1 Tax=Streptomyces silvensis TaxID=1765722 RepID=A0A0W7X6I5_9ACTN|nr:hypothetical protein [Streptomyces silvensis]KUF18472.1 hypothetical protein AT728_19195 [Streptomyces silvensis]